MGSARRPVQHVLAMQWAPARLESGSSIGPFYRTGLCGIQRLWPLFNGLCGVAKVDGPWVGGFEHGGPRADDGAPAHGDAGADKGIGSDPHIVFDDDWRARERKVRVAVVVRAGAEVGVLG